MKKYIKLAAAFAFMAAFATGCGKDYVKLGEYKGIEAERVVCEITDEELAEAVDGMIDDYVTYDEVTGRAAKEGDSVNVDYVIAKLDGEAYEPEDDDYYSGYGEDVVIGEEYIYPEVEKALIGMNKGDKKTVTAKLTDDFVDDDMAGKTAEIEVTLNEISVENRPDYNDAFVKENLDYETTAEYEADLKEQLLKEKEEEYKYETVSQIMQTIIDNSKFNGYDKEMYADCEEEYNSGNEQMAAMYGMELSDYEELAGIDEDTRKEDILSMVHEHQVIEAIAQAEGITVADTEVNEFVEGIYEDYQYESADDFIEDYGMEYLKYYLLSDKVYDFLYDNAKLTDITEEEYNERLEAEYEDYEEDEEADGEEIELEEEDEE
ncbi:MAG: FKBP-type peptidyl-prolyl cis-trans isomerase [Lachnospiraceae bacterium]|nr:FKBP-type peptidyl-prolyl cis-trans isomerase [Lachnospiraceae bacterium]